MLQRDWWSRTAGRLGPDEHGNIAILFALFMSLATVIGAYSVDEGAIYLERRQNQSAVDLASIIAAADPTNAFALARRTLTDAGLINPSISDAALKGGLGGTTLEVDTGVYTADSTRTVAARYSVGATPANAVHVRLLTKGTLYFSQGWAKPPVIGTEAVASARPVVTFSVGSTLAQLSDGIPNAVLNALLGANISLTAASYNGLLNTRVGLFSFLDALAQELSISAGTYQSVLNASADQGVIAKAIANALTGTDQTAMLALVNALGHNGKVPIARLFNLGDAARLGIGTGASSGYYTTVSALQLLAATGALSDGTHQVDLNLAAAVPGLTSLTMSVAVGEPLQFASWFALGPSGTLIQTAQIRVRFVATIGGGLTLLGGVLRLPLYLEVGYAQAGVTSATCPPGAGTTGGATIWAQPGVASLTVGDVSNADLANFAASPAASPATLLNVLNLLTITGSATANIGQTVATPLGFTAADIAAGTVKTATTTTFTQSLMTSLLQNLSLGVSLGIGIGIGLPSVHTVASTVGTLVSPLGPVIDAAVATTLSTLGVTLGDADVQVYGVNCKQAVLVR